MGITALNRFPVRIKGWCGVEFYRVPAITKVLRYSPPETLTCSLALRGRVGT